MDKPTIVEVRKKDEGARQPAGEQANQVEAGAQKNPRQPEEELSELERSVLDEMHKRGEISAEEEKQTIEEVRREEKKESAETKPNTQEITVASEESKPRVVEERDYSLIIQPPRKQALIKQERVGGVVVREESGLEKEKRDQASRDVLPTEAWPGTPVAVDERERAAELAEKIWKQKQAEKSWSYRVKKFLGFGGTATAGGGFT